jgi:hypothetical protein
MTLEQRTCVFCGRGDNHTEGMVYSASVGRAICTDCIAECDMVRTEGDPEAREAWRIKRARVGRAGRQRRRQTSPTAQLKSRRNDMEGVSTPHFTATCEFCGRWLDIRKPDVYRWTAGWVERGNDDITVTERFNRWAHQRFVENAVRDAAS